MSEISILLPVPGIGAIALTQDELLRGLTRGAELFNSYIGTARNPAPEADHPVQSERLLDAKGMEQATGVPASWFESAARTDQIPSVLFGRWRRYDLHEVLAHAKGKGIKRLAAVEAQPIPLAKRLKARHR